MPALPPLRLGVNIDHVATLRNARGGLHPDPVLAAQLAIAAGAAGITAHLREDRRHIRDQDVARLKAEIDAPLNLEMAATGEMLGIALKLLPHAACLVPERREERTTEGGLNVAGQLRQLRAIVSELGDAGIIVALFITPDLEQIEACRALGAPAIEIHTGTWCDAIAASDRKRASAEWQRICAGASRARELGLEVHAGHGLKFDTAQTIAAVPAIVELNIGHFLIGEAVMMGISESVKRMRDAMARGRAKASS